MIVNIDRVDKIKVTDLGVPMSVEDLSLMAFCLRVSAYLWEGKVDGKIACIWGLVPPTILSDTAYLWLYTTSVVDEHKFTFVRHSQRVLEVMLKEFSTIVGHCHVDASRSIQWLKWLGAEFGHPNGKLIPFTIRKKNG